MTCNIESGVFFVTGASGHLYSPVIFYLFSQKKTVKTVYDVWGKKFICAHFLEGQNFIKKKKKRKRKINLENNYFRKIKIFEKCFSRVIENQFQL